MTNENNSGEQHQGSPELPRRGNSGKVAPVRTETESNAMNEYSQEDPCDYAIRILRLLITEFVGEEPLDNALQIKKNPVAFGTAFEIMVYASPRYGGDINGSGGASLKALQAVCRRIKERTGKSITLHFEDMPGPGKREPRGRMVAEDHWDRLRLEGVLQEVFSSVFEECIVRIEDSMKRGGSTVAVVCSNAVKEKTVIEMQEIFTKPIWNIGILNKRYLSLAITRDAMLFNQLSMQPA